MSAVTVIDVDEDALPELQEDAELLEDTVIVGVIVPVAAIIAVGDT